MGSKTGIEWTDATWSPIRVRVRKAAGDIARNLGYTSLVNIAEKMAGRVGPHCEHVSPGCANCYAETNNHRCLPANGTGLPYDRRSRELVEAFVDLKHLLLPLTWRRPRRIFVENQSDLFGEWVTDEMRDAAFAIMALTPWHTYQVLTKRPAEMRRYTQRVQEDDSGVMNLVSEMRPAEMTSWHSLDRRTVDVSYDPEDGGIDCIDLIWPLPNVWKGVSVENQAAADERIPILQQTPAAVRFLSCEPLLGPLTFRPRCDSLADKIHAMEHGYASAPMELVGIDWVICGGESGPGARPVHPGWARSLRDQCQAAGVPFFFKQWGEYEPVSGDSIGPHVVEINGQKYLKCGKKYAGAILDGREWKQFPAVPA